ncbi:MAG: tripartite tricarboxylate transporter substrate binding protein [Verrucomicrobia bacterium]|nr:tripartite tricarboxylate transporter substrate binding protein [Verrucomicrobiota bacterium]
MSLKKWAAVIAGLSTAIIAQNALAGEFPERPIELVIHASYGGGTDTTARMMSIKTRRALGVDIVINSQRGGAGLTAQEYVLKKPADGYTVIALTQTHLYTMARGKTQMKIDDIIGIARAMDDPNVIMVSKDSPYKTLSDLVAASKKKKLKWGIGDIGNTEHVGIMRFGKVSGMEFVPVPFGGGSGVLQAVMSGAIDGMAESMSESRAQIDEGNLRPLAVMAEERLSTYPNIPTTFELGYPVKVSTTRGYGVLAGTPPEIVKILSDAFVKGMSSEVFANYLKGSGLTVEGSVAGTDVWTKNLKEEYANAEIVVEALGMK